MEWDYAADAPGEVNAASITNCKGEDARTARSLTPMRRPSPPLIRRRLAPNRRHCEGENAGEKYSKYIANMCRREGETCQQEWPIAKDDSITAKHPTPMRRPSPSPIQQRPGVEQHKG